MNNSNKPLAISIGEPAGIGPDLILRLYEKRKSAALPVFVIYGNIEFLRLRAASLGLEINFLETSPANANKVFPTSLPIVNIGKNIKNTPGLISSEGAKMALEAIIAATKSCLNGQCQALVTAPINKAALMNIGFSHPGHTEFLAEICASEGKIPTPIMMLADNDLRVVPLTIHVALAKVPKLLNIAMIVQKVRIIEQEIRQKFGLPTPKIGICGLNPHAGEEGAFGREEIEIITPAITLLQGEGMDISGPFPADTAFYPPNWRKFDVLVSMYHDQALIPIKTLAFEQAVNITLGLPIIRTSPDHGTAFDIAGTTKASTKSMLAAIIAAKEMAAQVKSTAT